MAGRRRRRREKGTGGTYPTGERGSSSRRPWVRPETPDSRLVKQNAENPRVSALHRGRFGHAGALQRLEGAWAHARAPRRTEFFSMLLEVEPLPLHRDHHLAHALLT